MRKRDEMADPKSCLNRALDGEQLFVLLGRDAEGTKLAGRLVGLPYLHRSGVPLGEVVFKVADRQAEQAYGMGNECAGVCGV